MVGISEEERLKQLKEALSNACTDLSYRILFACPIEPDNVLVINQLQLCGFEVDHVTSGARALERLESTAAELLVIDQKVDDMDGIELLERIREIMPGLPVIFMTSNGSEALALQAWKLSADEYITKPIDLAKFPEMIERTIYARKQSLEVQECRESEPGLKAFTICDIYIIGVDGRLIVHHSRGQVSPVDEDVFGGMLTVLRGFITDLFRGKTGQLKTIDYQSVKILLENGPNFFLVVVGYGEIIGPVRAKMASVTQRITERYGEIIEDWSGELSYFKDIEQELAALIEV